MLRRATVVVLAFSLLVAMAVPASATTGVIDPTSSTSS